MELSRDQKLKTEKSKPERLYCFEIGKLRQIGMSSWFGGSNWKFWTISTPALTIDVDSWWCCIMIHHRWRSFHTEVVMWWVELGTSGNLYSLGAQMHPQRVRFVNSWVRRRRVSRYPVRCGPVKVTFPEHCFEENSNWTVSGYLTSDKTRFCVKKAKNPGSRTVLKLGDRLHGLRFKALMVVWGKILWFYKQIIIVIITGTPNVVIIIFSHIRIGGIAVVQ